MTLDTTAARLEGLLERATKVSSTCELIGRTNWTGDKTITGFVASNPIKYFSKDLNAILDIVDLILALLAERRELKEECERLREALAGKDQSQ